MINGAKDLASIQCFNHYTIYLCIILEPKDIHHPIIMHPRKGKQSCQYLQDERLCFNNKQESEDENKRVSCLLYGHKQTKKINSHPLNPRGFQSSRKRHNSQTSPSRQTLDRLQNCRRQAITPFTKHTLEILRHAFDNYRRNGHERSIFHASSKNAIFLSKKQGMVECTIL